MKKRLQIFESLIERNDNLKNDLPVFIPSKVKLYIKLDNRRNIL